MKVMDKWKIKKENLQKWVIEESLKKGRNEWEIDGEKLVKDVEDFELMKMRMINGRNQKIEYMGFMEGKRKV